MPPDAEDDPLVGLQVQLDEHVPLGEIPLEDTIQEIVDAFSHTPDVRPLDTYPPLCARKPC
jgi:hypothetical protein